MKLEMEWRENVGELLERDSSRGTGASWGWPLQVDLDIGGGGKTFKVSWYLA
jgi:hypothetical protein